MHIEINIVPHHYNDGADLLIDDYTDKGPRAYTLDPARVNSVEGVRALLKDESDFIFNTVIGMMKEMARA